MVEPELNVSEKVCRRGERVRSPFVHGCGDTFLREVVRWRGCARNAPGGAGRETHVPGGLASGRWIASSIGLVAFSPRSEHSLQAKHRAYSASQRNVDQL